MVYNVLVNGILLGNVKVLGIMWAFELVLERYLGTTLCLDEIFYLIFSINIIIVLIIYSRFYGFVELVLVTLRSKVIKKLRIY